MNNLSDLLVSYKLVEAPSVSYKLPELNIFTNRFEEMMKNMQALKDKKDKEKTTSEGEVSENQTPSEDSGNTSGFVGWNYDNVKISPRLNSNNPTTRSTTLKGSRSLNENARYAYNYFVKNGISHAAAAGIVGNLWHEGLANPSKSNPDAKGTTSLGIAQFNSRGELPALLKWAKSKNLKETDFDTLLGYLTEVVKSGRVDLSDPNITPEQASFIFGRDFERFAGDNGKGYKNYEDSHHKRRRQTAINLYNQYKS